MKSNNLPVKKEIIQEYVSDENHACTGDIVTKFFCGCRIRMRHLSYGLLFVIGYNPCAKHCLECQRIEKENNDRKPEEKWDYTLTKQMHNVLHEIKGTDYH